METGCAAPIVVAGAIAATLAASVMKQPALVAVAPGGRDVNHNRNRRAEEALYNFLCRIEQTARRVELNHQTLHILCLCFFDASGNVTRCRGPDRAVDIDKANFLRSEHCRCHTAGQAKKNAGQQNLHSLRPNRCVAFR